MDSKENLPVRVVRGVKERLFRPTAIVQLDMSVWNGIAMDLFRKDTTNVDKILKEHGLEQFIEIKPGQPKGYLYIGPKRGYSWTVEDVMGHDTLGPRVTGQRLKIFGRPRTK